MSLRLNFRFVPALFLFASGSSCAVYSGDATEDANPPQDSHSAYLDSATTTFEYVDSRDSMATTTITTYTTTTTTSATNVTDAGYDGSSDAVMDTSDANAVSDTSNDDSNIFANCGSPVVADAGITVDGADPCTYGNCFGVLRVGDGCTQIAQNVNQPVFLEKRLLGDGTLVGTTTFPMPSATGAQRGIALQGQGPVEGSLALSPNNSYLTFVAGGYDNNDPDSGIAGGVIVSIDSTGIIDTSTFDACALGVGWGAVRDESNDVWASTAVGISFTHLGATPSTPCLVLTNGQYVTSQLQILSGQLYSGGLNDGNFSLLTIGIGLPKATVDGGVVVSALPGISLQGEIGDYAFVNLSKTVYSPSRVYIADVGQGLQRWDYDFTSGLWQQTSVLDPGAYAHVMAYWSSQTAVTLVATTAIGDQILQFVDDDSDAAGATKTVLATLPVASDYSKTQLFEGVSLLP